MTELRVATLNLWGRRGPWPDRLRLIRAELRRLSPALAGLQEVMRDDECQATEIAADLGYEVVYAPAATFDEGVLGNALLSALPVLDRQVFALPTAPGIESRALLYARVELPDGGSLPVFVTHLDWQPGHGAHRLAQARFIAERVTSLADGGPAVLMGDFNAEPSTGEIRWLTGAGGFTDTWVSGGDGSAGETFSPVNAYARRSGVSARRIDYIFTSGPRVAARTALAFQAPSAGVWPSDHFGLAGELTLS